MIPTKVKLFIWRALHGIVPLKCILANRHIGTTGECQICRLGPEDVRHLLFHCQAARDMWNSLDLTAIIDEAAQEDRADRLYWKFCSNVKGNSVQGLEGIGLKETISISCWYLWWLRRRRTHNEPVQRGCFLAR